MLPVEVDTDASRRDQEPIVEALQSNGLATREMEFPDRDHVLLWICERQLGRRNLTDDQRKMISSDKVDDLTS